ncbi:CheR family methyltransferase [Anabaena sp. PCC 7108]|uniref:CheR family methyltransferase n=1 Tax=Anabaena sp. PCC 7108 TaxID=163908 RepID=UPI00034AD842|nr:CheR family methyltransferase [Anabaena sp. PCC 7108]
MNYIEKDPEFENLLIYLRQNRGFDFTGYKYSTLMRRVCKRMQSLNLEDFGSYLDYLEVHPEEFNYLFNIILINVTSFFRDPLAWEAIVEKVLPNIIQGQKKTDKIRIWSAGCASGEEAYTIAMLMTEMLGFEEFRHRVKIYATDVDEEALNQGRQATYSAKDIHLVPQHLQKKYFEVINNRYVFQQDLRRTVIFGRHDLLQDAPISRLDLLVCRNTLMYFNSETQGRILRGFHFALKDTGYLFLGKAEMLLMYPNLFTPLDLKNRIFTKASQPNLRDRPLFMANSGQEESSYFLSKQVRLRDLAFDATPIAQIVVDTDNRLVMFNEQSKILFNLSNKDLNCPFQDLEISYRPLELRSLIEQVYNERHFVFVPNVTRYLSNTEIQSLDVRVKPLLDTNDIILGVSITFDDVTSYIHLQEELQRSKQEQETTNEELQSTNEELETTNEELQSTNEELETTNEELQSTNEELETMNEEVNSTNEELQSINDALNQKTRELNKTNVVLVSILRSLQTGILVIDQNFTILVWNHFLEDMWGLRTDEVLGHSLFSLDIGLPIEQLRSPILDTLSNKQGFQEMVLNALNRRGRQIRCYVSITPMLGTDMKGAVLMIADVEAVNSMMSSEDIEERRQQNQ